MATRLLFYCVTAAALVVLFLYAAEDIPALAAAVRSRAASAEPFPEESIERHFDEARARLERAAATDASEREENADKALLLSDVDAALREADREAGCDDDGGDGDEADNAHDADEGAPLAVDDGEEAIRRRFVGQASQFSSAVETLDARVFALMDATARLRNERAEIQAALAKLDADMEAALRASNYLDAQQVQRSLDGAHARLTAVTAELEGNRAALAQLEAERVAMHGHEVTELERLAQALQLNAEALAGRVGLALRSAESEVRCVFRLQGYRRALTTLNAKNKVAAQTKHVADELQARHAALEAKAGECAASSADVDAVKAKIAQATKELAVSLTGAERDVVAIDDEIAALERQIAAKREQKSAAEARAAHLREEISAVSGRFTLRQDVAEAALAQCAADQAAIRSAIDELNAMVKAIEQRHAHALASVEADAARLARVRQDADVIAQVRASLAGAAAPEDGTHGRQAQLRLFAAEKQSALDRVGAAIAGLQAEARAVMRDAVGECGSGVKDADVLDLEVRALQAAPLTHCCVACAPRATSCNWRCPRTRLKRRRG